jgi:protein TonB
MEASFKPGPGTRLTVGLQDPSLLGFPTLAFDSELPKEQVMNAHILFEEEEKVEAAPETERPFLLPPAKVAVSPQFFSDCFVETSGAERKRRGRSVLFSTALECLILGILLLLPLIYTDVLPARQLVSYLVAAPPPPPPPPPAPVAAIRPVTIASSMVDGRLMAPSVIPRRVFMIHEDEAPPPNMSGVAGGVVGGVPGGQMGGVLGGVLGGIAGQSHATVVQESKRVRISQGVSEGMLLTKVTPEYPRIAKLGHIGGDVVLEAIISKEGLIERLHVISGNPILIDSAMNAVQQWRYRPFLLDGTPVEVETKVTVMFTLGKP